MAEERLTIEARGLVAGDDERAAAIIARCDELRTSVQGLGLAFAIDGPLTDAIERAVGELADISEAIYEARYEAALARGLEATDTAARA